MSAAIYEETIGLEQESSLLKMWQFVEYTGVQQDFSYQPTRHES